MATRYLFDLLCRPQLTAWRSWARCQSQVEHHVSVCDSKPNYQKD